MTANPFIAAAAAGVVCAGGTLAILRLGGRMVPLDRPNERSLHERPVPRAGGIALLPALIAGWLLTPGTEWLPLLAAVLLGALSYVDDVRGLPVGWRLGFHLAAAAVLVPQIFAGVSLLWAAVFVLAVVWIANLYNFMDGSDGLAGGIAVVGFFSYGVAAGAGGVAWLESVSFAIAAAAAAFLGVNWHPARMFLGDSGSIPLGFLVGVLGLYGIAAGAWPLWFPLLVFAPFIGDATLTLLKRLARRERVWQAHRDHYYQRMVRMGLGHRGTALVEYAAAAACGALALWGRDQPPGLQALAFGAGVLILVVLAAAVDLSWRRFRSHQEGRAA